VGTAGGRISRPAKDKIAYLPQLAAIDCDYPITVMELIALGGWRHFGAFRAPPADALARMAAAVTTVGLSGALGRRISELSVGELRRALFARMIMQDAAVILLDEPFAAVDAPAISALLDQVVRWHQEGRTIIAVLHDLELVRMRFPSTLVLARRCVAWGPTEAALPAAA
jgi:zinc/manganese transport system ATP-binding protein